MVSIDGCDVLEMSYEKIGGVKSITPQSQFTVINLTNANVLLERNLAVILLM